MSTNFAKTLVWKQDYDVNLWRHKQRTPNTNDYAMPLNETPTMKFLRTPLFDTQVQMQYYSTDGFKLANKPTGKDETAVSEQLKETTE